MNALWITAALALGQADPDVIAPASTALDGVWTVVALEINGRPATLSEADRALAIRNNTLTLPGVAAIHGTLRLDLGPKGTFHAVPAAAGTGNRRDPASNPSGTGVVGGASGVYVRTADFLVLTIGDPSAATATGTGAGSKETPPDLPADARRAAPESPKVTVGQPPVSMILKRSVGTDAAPSTAATPPPATAPAAPGLRRLSTFIGSDVMLNDGSTAGRVEDVVYGANGTLDYAVLGNNGAFSAVPFGALNWSAANGLATLPLTATQFGTIPTFAAPELPNAFTNQGFINRLQVTFNNFQDADGRRLFNQLGNNNANRTVNQTGNQPGNQPGIRPGTQPGNQPGTQPGTQPGNPQRPNQPGNQPGTQPGNPQRPNQPGNQPGTQPGNPQRPNQPGNQPGGQPKPPAGTQPGGQPPPPGNPPGGQQKPKGPGG